MRCGANYFTQRTDTHATEPFSQSPKKTSSHGLSAIAEDTIGSSNRRRRVAGIQHISSYYFTGERKSLE